MRAAAATAAALDLMAISTHVVTNRLLSIIGCRAQRWLQSLSRRLRERQSTRRSGQHTLSLPIARMSQGKIRYYNPQHWRPPAPPRLRTARVARDRTARQIADMSPRRQRTLRPATLCHACHCKTIPSTTDRSIHHPIIQIPLLRCPWPQALAYPHPHRMLYPTDNAAIKYCPCMKMTGTSHAAHTYLATRTTTSTRRHLTLHDCTAQSMYRQRRVPEICISKRS